MGAIHSSPPLSVVIPTLDAAGKLGPTLAALENGGDIVREIVIADGGSVDATTVLAKGHGARVIRAPRGRGLQLAAGARGAQGEWLMFLHADTRLGLGWSAALRRFIAEPENEGRAGYFRFRLDDEAPAARRLEQIVAWRCRVLGLPYGDQGLVLRRNFYGTLGGFPPLPLMEDVALVRRIGKRRLVLLDADAVTSAARYHSEGYVRRSLRNIGCLGCYFMGVPPRLILRLYG